MATSAAFVCRGTRLCKPMRPLDTGFIGAACRSVIGTSTTTSKRAASYSMAARAAQSSEFPFSFDEVGSAIQLTLLASDTSSTLVPAGIARYYLSYAWLGFREPKQ